MVDEAMTIAHQLGMRTRDVINSRHDGEQDNEDDDEMDIQVRE